MTSNEFVGSENPELGKKSENLSLNVQDWGLIDYEQALLRQFDLVDLVHHELARETMVFCTHPPVVTLGRATREGDLTGWVGKTVEVNRGGRATYHGPSQIVVYPILDLNQRGRDLHVLMRKLEDAVVMTLADFGVSATGRSLQLQDGDPAPVEATGVWIGSRKIASIGIGVRHWISFHGLALNVEHDPQAFQGMKPCGFTSNTMTSLEEILGHKPDRSSVQNRLKQNLSTVLG
jgi:lipoyl(octanoyl) transferase